MKKFICFFAFVYYRSVFSTELHAQYYFRKQEFKEYYEQFECNALFQNLYTESKEKVIAFLNSLSTDKENKLRSCFDQLGRPDDMWYLLGEPLSKRIIVYGMTNADYSLFKFARTVLKYKESSEGNYCSTFYRGLEDFPELYSELLASYPEVDDYCNKVSIQPKTS